MKRITIIAVIAIVLLSMAPSYSALQRLTSKTWTSDADFDNASTVLNRVTHDLDHSPWHNQLELTKGTQPKPYIWVPNYDGTISKVDIGATNPANAGRELGRYRVLLRNSTDSPSRTTVDQNGNCWVGNRMDGTAVKVGLEENGKGVGWIDRDGDNVCDTSHDLNGDGNITGSEVLPFGQDECVLFEVLLKNNYEGTYVPGTVPVGKYDSNTYPRSLAVDKDNNVWVGCYSTETYYYIDGDTGQILQKLPIPGHRPYGSVMGRNGIVWSSGRDSWNIAKIDPSTTPATVTLMPLDYNPYGIGMDGYGRLVVSDFGSGFRCYQTDPWTEVFAVTNDYEHLSGSRGVACDDENNIWVVSSGNGRVCEYDEYGNFIRYATLGSDPTGVAKDSTGNMWVVDHGDDRIWKIDQSNGNILVEKSLIGTNSHYGYSDMCGTVIWDNTERTGTWTATWDTGIDASWGAIDWSADVPTTDNCWLKVKVRSSYDMSNWSPWEYAQDNIDLTQTPDGRYLQVQVIMHSDSPTVTPALYDITAWQVNSFLVNPKTVSIPEGSTNTFLVKLKGNPNTVVYGTISKLAGGDPDIVLQSSSTLAFTTANWNTWQVVTLRANEDIDAYVGTATFQLTNAQLRAQNVLAKEIDNDGPHSVMAWGSYGSGIGQLDHPMDVCADPFGFVYVADTQNHRVQKFTSSGAYVGSWGTRGPGIGMFEQPCGICSDSQGNIFVADTYNNRVQVFRSNGQFVYKMDGHNLPWGITCGPGDFIYLADTYYHHIDKFYPRDTDNDGLYDQWDGYGSMGGQGSGDGQLLYPEGVAVDGIGRVYAVDTYNNRISVFDNNTYFLQTLGDYGTLGGLFRYPKAACIDPSTGDLYVSNTYNHRMDLWANNAYQSSWGSYGTAVGQFASPGGVNCDTSGDIFIADTDNNRIQKYYRQPVNIREYPDGTHVAFGPVTVTAMFWSTPYRMYVENANRTFGIRLDSNDNYSYEDYIVSVSGTIQTDSSTGERYVMCDSTYPRYMTTGPSIVPLGMRNEWIKTTSSNWAAVPNQGYPFYSAGMLVSSWGRVTYTDPNGAYFIMHDGSQIITFPGTSKGEDYDFEWAWRKVMLPSYTSMPAVGAYVKVTGINGRESTTQPLLIPRDSEDITTVNTWDESELNVLSEGWNYLSLPGIPSDPNPEAVWVGCSGGPGIELAWYAQRYYAVRQRWYWYMECSGFGNAVMGEGYALYIPPGGASCYSYPRTPVPEGVDELISLPRGSSNQTSFSLIGNPYPSSVPWSACTISDGMQTKSIQDAQLSSWIWKVQEWNGASWQDVSLATETMQANTAYKVFPARNGLALVIPHWAVQ